MKMIKTTHCLNCHTYIGSTNYCHNCGQLNTHKKIPIRQFLKDFMGDYFTFDSKFFRSLFPLLLKPGFLTNEYVTGRRVNYIFPLRLYIFTTFIFVFVFTLQTKLNTSVSETNIRAKTEIAQDSLRTILTEMSPDLSVAARASILERITEEFSIEIKHDWDNINIQMFGSDSVRTISNSDEEVKTTGFLGFIEKKAKYLGRQGENGKKMFWKAMVEQIPKVLFLLMPVFALILKLLYIRKKRFYVEHLVFSLHIHTFMFIYLIFIVLLPKWYVIVGFFLLSMIHLFLSLKNVYQQSGFKTFIKMTLLNFFYSLLAIPAVGLLLLLALWSI